MEECPLRWCKSGMPAVLMVNENIGDASFVTRICIECADAIPVTVGGDLPSRGEVERKLRRRYSRRTED